MNIQELITKVIKETNEATIKNLKSQGLLKEKGQTPFQKTEILLYNYKNYIAAIKDKEMQIEIIKQEGSTNRSKDITSFRANAFSTHDLSDEMLRPEKEIEKIQLSINKTKVYILKIDAALEIIKGDPYYEIITMYYFEKKTREDIAEHFDCDPSTISRNKKRLVNLLQIRLFSEDTLSAIFE